MSDSSLSGPKAKKSAKAKTKAQRGSKPAAKQRPKGAGAAGLQAGIDASAPDRSNQPICIGGVTVMPGERRAVDIPMAPMVTHTDLQMTVNVVCGRKAGPVLFVCAAIHGDEINGVEIIRRLLKAKNIHRIRGTLVAIPVVNVHGFVTRSRYFPDGRDLNRCFPGSRGGSLAARTANKFLQEIILKCTHGIDLHTGARHRDNLSQIRADLSDERVRLMASQFGVPVIIDSKVRDGSLREAAGNADIPVLLYETGEALRFSELGIRAGVRGVQNVMRHLGMLPGKQRELNKQSVVTDHSSWLRAPCSGVLRALVPLGAQALKGSVLGVISDPLGDSEHPVVAPESGIVIGRTNLPLVLEGDALFHMAYFEGRVEDVLEQVEAFQERLDPQSVADESLDSLEGPIL